MPDRADRRVLNHAAMSEMHLPGLDPRCDATAGGKRCQRPAGHPGAHERVYKDGGMTWPQQPIVDAWAKFDAALAAGEPPARCDELKAAALAVAASLPEDAWPHDVPWAGQP